MKKRIVSLLLSVVMLISLLSVNAFAADKFTLKGSTHELEKVVGQTISFKVDITKNPGMIAGKFTVKWDNTALELTGVTFNSKGYPDRGTPEEITSTGSFPVSFGDYLMKSNSTFTGTLATLTFKVLAAAETKTYPITVVVNSDDMMDKDGNEVACEAVNGSITLKAKTVAVTSVAVSPKTLDLEVGQKFQLAATVKPDEATDKTVTWKVTKGSDVVSVSADGEVTAIKAGSATITVAAGGKTATCTVTVKVPACNHSEDKLTHVDGKAATCTEDGVKEHYLCTCGTKLDLDKKTVLATTVIPATGHKTEKEENKATCAKLAVCDVCGESYGSLKKHTVVKVDKVDPTCNTPGVKAHYECSVCGKWFSDKNGTKEIAEADKASYVIPADPDMHVYDIVKDSYKEYDEGYYVEQFQCTKCGDSYWLASVDLRNVDVKLVQDGKGDLKNAKVEVASTSVKTKEVMSLYYNDTANAGDTLSLPVFFNYSKSATEAEAIAALKKDIAENSTFTVKAAATKSGWKFTTDKTYTVTVELDDAGKIVTKWVGSDNTEVSAENTPTFTITGKKTTGGGGNGGSGNGGSTTTDTTKNDGKKVESGKTFDAGIAMYVGLSVLSVTGGALVIGKKKERF